MGATQKLKSLFQNLLLVFSALLVVFLLLEFVVFRFILIASDFPAVQTVNTVVKYTPNQNGIMRVGDCVAAQYTINSDGWNSQHKTFPRQKSPGKKRIAVIGDSYVEGFGVDFNQNMAELLEKQLGSDQYEVFRFGIGGAPMSQYLHLLRHEVIPLAPDTVIVVLAHTDFDESYTFLQGLYDSYFLKLEIADSRVVREIPPKPYRRRWFTPIRYSATWRYLHVRRKISFHFLKNIILGRRDAPPQTEADITHQQTINKKNTVATDYIFRQLKALCAENNIRLMLLIDGDRYRVYAQGDDLYNYDSGALILNRIARDTARKYAIEFIDLHPIFADAYQKDKKRFNCTEDVHWNQLAHQIVAANLYTYLKKHPNQLVSVHK